MENRITKLFKIKYPIIQAGMVWCSGWKLASAVSNQGGLGIIGAGSMHPETLQEHIDKCQEATSNPFAVNLPLLYPEMENVLDIIVKSKVKIVFTSAGNPKKWTSFFKEHGITVVHVVSSKKFALKSEEAGVDAIVAEGFEAGGHNGRDETTSLCLIPAVCDSVNIPVIAAGGIGSGRAMAAAFSLGAEGVQIGTRFAASKESSAHENFKNCIVNSEEGDTVLTLKKLTPVRLIKNPFYEEVKTLEERGAEVEELISLLGKRRAKQGIFEGDLAQGELEIGQISAQVKAVESAAEIMNDIWSEFISTSKKLYDSASE